MFKIDVVVHCRTSLCFAIGCNNQNDSSWSYDDRMQDEFDSLKLVEILEAAELARQRQEQPRSLVTSDIM